MWLQFIRLLTTFEEERMTSILKFVLRMKRTEKCLTNEKNINRRHLRVKETRKYPLKTRICKVFSISVNQNEKIEDYSHNRG